jgi:hypothetical protein
MTFELDFMRKPTPIARTSSLSLNSSSYNLRCDAKQAEERFLNYLELISSVEHFSLGEYLPRSFIKGVQPKYIESLETIGVPVINTLSIQNLQINRDACRFISEEDYNIISEDRKLKQDDVLLTLDGGTSIGKPVLFNLDEDFTIDSHIAIIRSPGIPPITLVYLLASPFSQLQFQQAESGASGQTAVTEDDIRRFKYPRIEMENLNSLVKELDSIRVKTERAHKRLRYKELGYWKRLNLSMLEYASRK